MLDERVIAGTGEQAQVALKRPQAPQHLKMDLECLDAGEAGITNAASVLAGLRYLAPVRPGQTLCLRDDGQRRLLGLHSLALQALTVLLLVPFVYSVVWHDSCDRRK